MKNKILKDSLVTGFAVFAIFFGAGNLIFPGGVGLAAGEQWVTALIATLLCGIALPLLSLIAVASCGDGWSDLCKPVGKWYDKGAFFVSTVGMVILSNLPRTAATTHEVAIAPLFPNCPSWVTVVIFFGIAFFLSFDENSLIDRVGKYLTPIMLVLLVIIVAKALITPLGTPAPASVDNVFGTSFVELYYTGDLFSGLFISSIFLADLAHKGYSDHEDRKKMTIRACIVAGIAFTVVYGGLLVMGAQSSSTYTTDLDRTTLLANMVHNLLGNFGTIALSISVALACVSTACGLLGIAANFLASLTKDKLSYRVWLIILTVTGILMACTGVENIISVAAPVFFLLYPSGLTVTFLGLFRKYVPNNGAYKGAVIGAVIAGAMDSLGLLGVGICSTIMGKMPLASCGFSWLAFAVIGFIIGCFADKKSEK